MRSIRILSIAAGAGLLATLGGCVVAPVGPPPRAYVQPGYGYAYPAPPAVVVEPRGYYYGGGYYRGGPRYRY